MLITHVVARPFSTAGRSLTAGTKVNASSWKNTDALVTSGYLRPATDADKVETPVPAKKTFKLKK